MINPLISRITVSSAVLFAILILSVFLGISAGSSGIDLGAVFRMLTGDQIDSMLSSIIWRIRFPRVIIAAFTGATLSLGGLVFQALLRNPLSEPYILGISGGSAIGAIIGILAGLSRFPGVCLMAFAGSMITLMLLMIMSAGDHFLKKDTLLLSGVMVNAFCSAVIMFLVSITQDSRLFNIMFWLMGDLSMADGKQAVILGAMVLPCFLLLFYYSHSMNLMLLGREMALSMGINIRAVTVLLLVVTSFMVSATVSHCGLVGFVGLVMPHLLRIILGSDHRVLVPACVLGGGSYMVLCDLLARVLPKQGEMPVGVLTALIGAPVFVYLLKMRS